MCCRYRELGPVRGALREGLVEERRRGDPALVERGLERHKRLLGRRLRGPLVRRRGPEVARGRGERAGRGEAFSRGAGGAATGKGVPGRHACAGVMH